MVSPQIRSQWSSLNLLLCNQKQDLVEEYFCLCPIVVGQRRLGLSSSTSHSLLKPEVWAQCSFWSHHAKYGIQMYVAGEKEKKKERKREKQTDFHLQTKDHWWEWKQTCCPIPCNCGVPSSQLALHAQAFFVFYCRNISSFQTCNWVFVPNVLE